MSGQVLGLPQAVSDLPPPIPAVVKDGRLERLLETLTEDLRTRGELDLSECFIDGTFIVAKKGAAKFGKTKRGKGRSSWQSIMMRTTWASSISVAS